MELIWKEDKIDFQAFEEAWVTIEGVKCWEAHKLLNLLNCDWDNMPAEIEKAKESCRNAGKEVSCHFLDVRRIQETGFSAKVYHELYLTRYGCYLIAQNCDSYPALRYFAMQKPPSYKKMVEISRGNEQNGLKRISRQLLGETHWDFKTFMPKIAEKRVLTEWANLYDTVMQHSKIVKNIVNEYVLYWDWGDEEDEEIFDLNDSFTDVGEVRNSVYGGVHAMVKCTVENHWDTRELDKEAWLHLSDWANLCYKISEHSKIVNEQVLYWGELKERFDTDVAKLVELCKNVKRFGGACELDGFWQIFFAAQTWESLQDVLAKLHETVKQYSDVLLVLNALTTDFTKRCFRRMFEGDVLFRDIEKEGTERLLGKFDKEDKMLTEVSKTMELLSNELSVCDITDYGILDMLYLAFESYELYHHVADRKKFQPDMSMEDIRLTSLSAQTRVIEQWKARTELRERTGKQFLDMLLYEWGLDDDDVKAYLLRLIFELYEPDVDDKGVVVIRLKSNKELSYKGKFPEDVRVRRQNLNDEGLIEDMCWDGVTAYLLRLIFEWYELVDDESFAALRYKGDKELVW
ncbi:MAG: hypothetical protein LBR34_08660, partial [Prevotella sp.]|nr:hypothetical protein [Prevotella sp.]